jgi:hypothetical protein
VPRTVLHDIDPGAELHPQRTVRLRRDFERGGLVPDRVGLGRHVSPLQHTLHPGFRFGGPGGRKFVR